MRRAAVLGPFLFTLGLAAPSGAFELGLPARCELGVTCFVQSYPDLDPGPDVADPWCGGASNDGHDGTDLRVLSMADAAKGVPVVAAADGTVTAMRDEVPDLLARTEEARAAVAGIECGNGVVIDSGEGWETQYCHMRLGSVAVQPGQAVKRGDVLGLIGSSGLAEFPHVHMAVRKDGTKIDPFSGKPLTAGCDATAETGGTLWDNSIGPGLAAEHEGAILDLGFSGAALDYDSLVVSGAPPEPDASAKAFVGWVWLANLRAGDQVSLRIVGPDGSIFSRDAQAIDRPKAVYVSFAGRSRAPAPGTYTLVAEVVRGGVVALAREKTITIK